MKLIHLSDLHIGKKVNGFSMLEDQQYILKQILSVVKDEKPDGVILAGDIYDKPVPPTEAVRTFDWFLTELSKEEIQVFAVSGNHDSAERVAFGAALMREKGIWLSPVYQGEAAEILLEDDYGQAAIYLLPFLKPSVVRPYCEGEIKTSQDAVKAAVDRIRLSPGRRNVLVAHQFVTGAARCDSEEVSVGGVDNVEAAVFKDFDYVALGHIHSPQHVGREEVRYCGTPLKYSFSEEKQEKSLTVAELGKKGQTKIRTIGLRPLREMRTVKGTYEEVMQRSFSPEENREDYLQIILTDEDDVVDAAAKLRSRYPRLMRLDYDNKRTREYQKVTLAQTMEEKSEEELFEEFYQMQNNQPMREEQRTFLRRLIGDVRKEQDGGGV